MKDFDRPPDHDERMWQARRRAQWELGDPSWAGVIMAAYMHPDADRKALDVEEGDRKALDAVEGEATGREG